MFQQQILNLSSCTTATLVQTATVVEDTIVVVVLILIVPKGRPKHTNLYLLICTLTGTTYHVFCARMVIFPFYPLPISQRKSINIPQSLVGVFRTTRSPSSVTSNEPPLPRLQSAAVAETFEEMLCLECQQRRSGCKSIRRQCHG